MQIIIDLVKKFSQTLRIIFLGLFGAASWFLHGSPLKLDEEVIFFPTSANLNESGLWEASIHTWVFELEENSISRKLSHEFIGEVLERFNVTEEQTNSSAFRERLKWFLVDNERNKKLTLTIDKQKLITPRTGANGHTDFIAPLSTTTRATWLDFSLEGNANDPRLFSGKVQLIPQIGLSIISDIDDTIKISEVLDKEALIQNIFFKEYETSKGMPEFYKTLSEQGAFFHYVSASPRQLYPTLKPFMDQYYPEGVFYLRHFRITDSSFIKFFLSSQDYKVETIKNIIQRYPHHQFILIGDSGEKDPEIYASIHAQFPDNIKNIFIRKVKGSDLSNERTSNAFKHIPEEKWMLFNTAEGINLK